MIAQEGINTIVQLTIVFLFAGLAYLIAGRKRGKFLKFVGLYLPTAKSMKWALMATLVLVPLTLALFYFTPLGETATADNTIAGKFRASGFSAEIMVVIVLVAFIKTGFAEELFFRGLIAKRLINWLGYMVGNIVQAVLFGAIHMAIFIVPGGPEFSLPIAGAFFAITAGGAFFMAFLNERVGNGSIGPSWLLHAITNASAYPVLAFL